MVNRRGVLFFVLLFVGVLLSGSVLSQNLPSPEGLDESTQKIINAAENLRDYSEKEKWDYLSEQWRELLLKNKIVSFLDSIFNKFDFLFSFFFGEEYDISLTFLFSVLLWVFFMVVIGRSLSDLSTFSKPVSWIASVSLATILAHLYVYKFLSEFLFKLIFFSEGIWWWVNFVIFLIVYFVILIYVRKIYWKIGRGLKKSQEEKEKWDMKFKFKIFEKRLEGVDNAFGKVEDAFSE